jgi:hypothetical protein
VVERFARAVLERLGDDVVRFDAEAERLGDDVVRFDAEAERLAPVLREADDLAAAPERLLPDFARAPPPDLRAGFERALEPLADDVLRPELVLLFDLLDLGCGIESLPPAYGRGEATASRRRRARRGQTVDGLPEPTAPYTRLRPSRLAR